VVGADGRNSLVRRWAGIEKKDWAYPQTALTTIVGHARDHKDASTEFHTRAGPCTLVPLPGRRSSVVWMTEPEEGKRLVSLPDAELAAAIEKRCASYLGGMKIDGPRGLVPMGGLSVSAFSAENAALVGEAAHVFPPIGAQGLNLGLRDVEGLIDTLEMARDNGEPLGSAAALRRYDDNRRGDVAGRTKGVDILNRTLLADFLPADFARGLGLLALSTIGPLRRLVMRKGVGPHLSAFGP
jgi:2-octaprenyl-6-methoxyphenol hydroxylase